MNPELLSIMTWFRSQKLQNNSLLEENECPGALSQAPVSEEDDVPQVDCIYFLESLFGQDANHKAGAVVLNLEWFLCLNWALGLLGHAAWFQESALPTSSLVLTPGSASPAARWATGSDSSGPCLWPQCASTSARAPQGSAITYIKIQLATQIKRGSEEYVLEEGTDKTLEDELSKVIAYLHEKDLRVVIIKMFKELGRRMGTQRKELQVFKWENTKNNQMWKIQ